MTARFMILALLTVCCSWAQKVTVEFDEAADFSKFHTFAIRDGRLNSANPALNSDEVRKLIDTEIEKALKARGLTKVAGRSDLSVRYTYGVAPRTALDAYPDSWRGGDAGVVRVPFTEGTLVIDFRNPNTRSLVWRGIAREDKTDPAKIQGKLDDMVRKAIDKYPPKK
jgi:hypothetical protein